MGKDLRVGFSLENVNGKNLLESARVDRKKILKCAGKE